jgi:hypothetical protein
MLAYIDPNSGGWIFQLFFPLFVAATALWAAIKVKAGLLKDIIARRKKRNDESSSHGNSGKKQG